MELARLIEFLADPAAYSVPVQVVEVRHTHISAVFLTDQYVYKIKKPVTYGFLDFSTLAKRRHFCDEEVRLNRRLAPDVYLGVVPVTCSDSRIQMDGNGEIVEWAVKMRRLPDDATLQNCLQQEWIGINVANELARKIATFHAQAESGPSVAAFGRFDVVAGNARDNFEESKTHVGITVSEAVFKRVRLLTDEALDRHQSLIEQRAERNVPRDTHGDLRLGHVYYFPDKEPPSNFIIIDCIEFNERFRFSDPVSDIAFLFMGLVYAGRRDLAQAFAEAYFDASNDSEGSVLLPFYTAYRAVVRGKVEGLKLARPEISEADRTIALTKARGSWLLGLGELEEPDRRPSLIVIAGLPGTGKSTLAQALTAHAGCEVIPSDLVRKGLAGVGQEKSSSDFGEGIYTAEWTQRTYAECLRRAEELLFQGKRVLVDANFREESQRRTFLDTATRSGVSAAFLLCQARPEVVRQRLASRHGDVSDADWSVYTKAAELWEEFQAATRLRLHIINTEGTHEQILCQALATFRKLNLLS